MKVTVIPVVVDALGIVPRDSRKDRNYTTLNKLEYFEESWKPDESCCHLD